MEPPARPFAGRLLAEIARLGVDLPVAAAEMGVDPEVIDRIAQGNPPTPQELQAVYSWLAQRSALTTQETEDFERLQAAASSKSGGELERRIRHGEPSSPATRNVTLTLPQLLIGAAVIVILAVVLSTIVATSMAKTGNDRPSAEGSSAPPASPSPSPSSASPEETPPSSATSSEVATASPSPGSPTPAAAPNPPKLTVFRSSNISIAEIDSSTDGDTYYKNLSVNPPQTTTDISSGDVSLLINDTGTPPAVTLQAVNSTTIGMWHQNSEPTYGQCKQTAKSGGVGQIDVSQNQTVCVMTSSGAVASLKLLSVDSYNSANFSGTIWYPSNTP